MSPSPMKSREHNLSEEDPQTISRPSSRLDDADEESFLKKIPIEVTIEIFSRLPLKSIARCRCVSKRWASILRRQDFTDLFLTRSLARPQLLLAFQRNCRRLVFFSSSQSRENVSLIAADHHLSFGGVDSYCYHISSIVNGVFCITHDPIMETRECVLVICNPSTRQSFTLPKMKTTERTGLIGFLGYDPIEKQHKVLAMTVQDGRAEEHQVLTLGTGNLTWRMVECGIPHPCPCESYVCINGVLYYTAWDFVGGYMVLSFDFKSEKYSFVKPPEGGMSTGKLINFQGKLASVGYIAFHSEESFSLKILILKDPEKHEWSERVFNLPPLCKDGDVWDSLSFVGVTATDELVFSHSFPSDLYYYNFVSKDISRVEIQGIGAFQKNSRPYVILNHVEDAKIMDFVTGASF